MLNKEVEFKPPPLAFKLLRPDILRPMHYTGNFYSVGLQAVKYEIVTERQTADALNNVIPCNTHTGL